MKNRFLALAMMACVLGAVAARAEEATQPQAARDKQMASSQPSHSSDCAAKDKQAPAPKPPADAPQNHIEYAGA